MTQTASSFRFMPATPIGSIPQACAAADLSNYPDIASMHPFALRNFLKILAKHIHLGLISILLIGCSAKADNYSDNNIFGPTQVPYIINNITYYPIPDASGYNEKGVASWYGPDFHGNPTSNGERYNMYGMTAAHKTLPMNTMLLVKNLDNGKEIVVRINDRGPFVRGRIIDLSYKAAKALKIVKPGISRVQIVAMAEKSRFSRSTGSRSRLPDMRKGEFYVQIGAFSKKENAINLQKQFTDAGHTTVIQPSFNPKRTFYLVHVYAGKELAVAKRAESDLLKHGYAGAFLVAR